MWKGEREKKNKTRGKMREEFQRFMKRERMKNNPSSPPPPQKKKKKKGRERE